MAVDLAMDFQICRPPCAFGLPPSTLGFVEGVLYHGCDGRWVTVLVRQGANLSSAAAKMECISQQCCPVRHLCEKSLRQGWIPQLPVM